MFRTDIFHFKSYGRLTIRAKMDVDILTRELLNRNIIMDAKYMIDMRRKYIYNVRDKMVGDFTPLTCKELIKLGFGAYTTS
jgi:hypothetical protein